MSAEQKSQREALDLLKHYEQALNLPGADGSDKNRFRGILLNKMNENMTRAQKQQVHEQVPVMINNQVVDTYKWMQV